MSAKDSFKLPKADPGSEAKTPVSSPLPIMLHTWGCTHGGVGSSRASTSRKAASGYSSLNRLAHCDQMHMRRGLKLEVHARLPGLNQQL